jgi:cell shape-determining protein MreD
MSLMRSDSSASFLLPIIIFGLSLAVILLGMAWIPLPTRIISPILLLPLTYCWRVYYPQGLPLFSIFVLGIISDTIMGLPLGTLALAALLQTGLVHHKIRHLRRNFSTLWLHFFLHLTGVMVMILITLSLYQWRLIVIQPFFLQFLVTFLCYPPIHLGIHFFLSRMRLIEKYT